MGLFKSGLMGKALGISPIGGIIADKLTGGKLSQFGDNATGKFKGLIGADKGKMDDVADQGQQDLIALLQARARGQNSVAEMQTRQGLEQNHRSNISGINSIGGIGASLKRKRINDLNASAGQEMAQKGGMARLSEMNASQDQLGNVLSDRATLKAGIADKDKERRAGLFRALGQAGASVMGGK